MLIELEPTPESLRFDFILLGNTKFLRVVRSGSASPARVDRVLAQIRSIVVAVRNLHVRDAVVD